MRSKASLSVSNSSSCCVLSVCSPGKSLGAVAAFVGELSTDCAASTACEHSIVVSYGSSASLQYNSVVKLVCSCQKVKCSTRQSTVKAA